MDRMYPEKSIQITITGSRGLIIVSRRLLRLILNKSLRGQWLNSYFELKKDVFLDDVVCVKALGTNGIFLGVM
jgi:hypothetical protein